MGNILKLNDIKTKGCADYPCQNTYLIMELWNELKELQAKVNLLELAAMKDEDIDFSDIPATTDEELSRFTRMNKDLWDKGAYG